MEFTNLIHERYSVRKYSNQPIEKEKMDKIVDSQNYAPTAVNLQPQKVYVVQGTENMNKLKLAARNGFGAPAALIVGFDARLAGGPHPMTGRHDVGAVASATVATYMMLEAWNQGIGSCWFETFDHEQLKSLFGLPSWFEPMHIVMLGYPSDDAKPYAPWHNVYKPTEELVTYL